MTLNAYEQKLGIQPQHLDYLKYFTVNATQDKYDPNGDPQKPFLPERVRNILKENDIASLYDVRNYAVSDLLGFDDAGPKFVETVVAWVKQCNGIFKDAGSAMVAGYWFKHDASIPNYADLGKTAKPYIANANRLMDETRPGWRSQIPVPTNTEQMHKEKLIKDFVRNRFLASGQESFDQELSAQEEPLKRLDGQMNPYTKEPLKFVGDAVVLNQKDISKFYNGNVMDLANLDMQVNQMDLRLNCRMMGEAEYNSYIKSQIKQAKEFAVMPAEKLKEKIDEYAQKTKRNEPKA